MAITVDPPTKFESFLRKEARFVWRKKEEERREAEALQVFVPISDDGNASVTAVGSLEDGKAVNNSDGCSGSGGNTSVVQGSQCEDAVPLAYQLGRKVSGLPLHSCFRDYSFAQHTLFCP